MGVLTAQTPGRYGFAFGLYVLSQHAGRHSHPAGIGLLDGASTRPVQSSVSNGPTQRVPPNSAGTGRGRRWSSTATKVAVASVTLTT